MSHERAVVAYRYHVTDIDTWPQEVVHIFYRRITDKDSHR